MKKYLIVLSVLLLFSECIAQKKLTLDEAISIALQRNSNLIQTKNGLMSNEAQVKSAYGDFMPNFGFSGTWQWQRISDDGGTQLDFYGNPIYIDPSQSDSRSYSFAAGGRWTLFNGLSNFANLSQSNDELEAAKLNFERVKENTILQAAEYFYAVLYAQEILKVRKDNVQYNKKFLEQVEERNKLGSVAIADVYAQQVQLGNAELLLIQAENTLENSKSTLLNYLALDVLEIYEFVDPFGDVEASDTDEFLKEFTSIDSMVKEAFANRLDYRSQQYTLDAAESGVTAAKGGLFPSLTGDYSYSTRAAKTDELFNRRIWNVGLSLSFPIFSNWNTENNIQFAEVQSLNAAEELNALERQIKIEVKQGYLDLTAGKKSLEVASKNVISAQETRRINNERYNLGSGTILDVLQADRDYQDALSGRLDALYNFYTLRDRLLNYLGKIDSKKFE